LKNFLRKIKVLDSFELELPISKNEFITIFKGQVNPGSTNLFSHFFEIFSSNKKKYVGKVNSGDFEIRRRRTIYSGNRGHILASGRIKEEDKGIKITTEINGFPNSIKILMSLTLAIYSGFTIPFIVNDFFSLSTIFILLLFIILVASPVYVARWGVAELKSDLEREFFFSR